MLPLNSFLRTSILFISLAAAAPFSSEDVSDISRRDPACIDLHTCSGEAPAKYDTSTPNSAVTMTTAAPPFILKKTLPPALANPKASRIKPPPSAATMTTAAAPFPAKKTLPPALANPKASRIKPPPSAQTVISPAYYYCSKEQKSMIQEAWAEAAQLAQAHTDWQTPGRFFGSGAYQPAMSMYLGSDSSKDTPLLFGRGPLRKNIDRQLAIHKGDAPFFTYAYFYCDETKLPGRNENSKKTCGPSTTAFTFDNPGWTWTNHYVNFCPTFFSDRMSSLATKVEEAKKDSNRQKYINEWRKARARSLFHETYHWKDTVSVPAARPKRGTEYSREIYQPRDVVNLAKNRNTEIAKLNAESWAQAAMAIFVQETFKLKNPPSPDPNPAITDADELEELYLDAPPEGFVSPPQPATAGAPLEIGGES